MLPELQTCAKFVWSTNCSNCMKIKFRTVIKTRLITYFHFEARSRQTRQSKHIDFYANKNINPEWIERPTPQKAHHFQLRCHFQRKQVPPYTNILNYRRPRPPPPSDTCAIIRNWLEISFYWRQHYALRAPAAPVK